MKNSSLVDVNKKYETYGINVDIPFIYTDIYWDISSFSGAGKLCNCTLKYQAKIQFSCVNPKWYLTKI